MAKPSGVILGAQSVSHVFKHFRLFANIVVLWSAVVTLAIGVACVVIASSEGSPLSSVTMRMEDGDLMRQYLIVTSIPSTFGQLATAVGWSRYILLKEAPQPSLSMPKGSARYFARSVILLLGAVALAIPGFIVGAIVGSLVPNDAGKIAAAVVMGIGALIAIYICIRAWLVFPAVSIGRDMEFREAFRLTKGFTTPIVIGSIISYGVFMLLAMIPMMVIDLFGDLEDALYIAAVLVLEFINTVLIYGAVAASAGVMARIYAHIVPAAEAHPEQIAAFD